MKTVRSADGTTIAFDKRGKGPALILVGGALEQRAMDSETAQLAPLLVEHFTVLHYDRRGRGDSTDTQAYAIEREIEDIEVLITEAGGSASVFGISSGAALAMEAAIKLGDKVKQLAKYEAPYNSDEAAEDASVPTAKAASVTIPTLVMDGSASYPFMHVTALALVKAMLHAEHRTLEGQTHEVEAEALAPVLVEFFNSNVA